MRGDRVQLDRAEISLARIEVALPATSSSIRVVTPDCRVEAYRTSKGSAATGLSPA